MKEEQLVECIVESLRKNKASLKSKFQNFNGITRTKFFTLDNLFPESVAHEIYNSFPKGEDHWRHLNSFRENKFTTKKLDETPLLLREVTFALQNEKVVKEIEEITGIKNQIPDRTLYAGGLSMMKKNHFLNPHIDNSHNQDRTLYRRVNLLYYVTPGWSLEKGGNLELWDESVKLNTTVESLFNRLVVMETNESSWHSVNKVVVDSPRCCVSNYYFSKESPLRDKEYFHVTAFNGRPKEKLIRTVSYFDNGLRSFVRKLVPIGLGKKDTFNNN